MIELKQVVFSYPGMPSVLNGISFTLKPDDVTMLLGANGSGKSTLLGVTGGRLMPQSGTVQYRGAVIANLPPRFRATKIATVMQTPDPATDLTVYELAMIGRNPFLPRFGEPRKEDKDAVNAALALLKLTDLKNRRLSRLSGGERQRAAIASAVARQSEFLLLDEPTAAADPAYRAEIVQTLLALPHHPGILMTTHDITAAKHWAKRVILLKNGLIFADGTPEQTLTGENVSAVYGPNAVFFL